MDRRPRICHRDWNLSSLLRIHSNDFSPAHHLSSTTLNMPLNILQVRQRTIMHSWVHTERGLWSQQHMNSCSTVWYNNGYCRTMRCKQTINLIICMQKGCSHIAYCLFACLLAWILCSPSQPLFHSTVEICKHPWRGFGEVDLRKGIWDMGWSREMEKDIEMIMKRARVLSTLSRMSHFVAFEFYRKCYFIRTGKWRRNLHKERGIEAFIAAFGRYVEWRIHSLSRLHEHPPKTIPLHNTYSSSIC